MARFVALIAVLLLVSGTYASKNDTDKCLDNVNQVTILVPAIINDVLTGNVLQLMLDVGKLTPLINQTKQACGNASLNDVANQSTIAAIQVCYNSTGPVVDAFNQLVVDAEKQDIGAIIKDIGTIIAAGNNLVKVCNATIPIISNPHNFVNFYNSTLCWATHERNVLIKDQLVEAVQSGNITAALPLVLPFVGSSAETFRQCSIYPNSFGFQYRQYTPVYNYSFLERSNKTQDCFGDVLILVDGLLPVFRDLNTQNYFQLFTDLKDLAPILKHTIKDCPATIREIEFRRYINASAIGDFNTCIADVKADVEIVKEVIAAIQAGDFGSLIAKIPQLIDALKKTVTDCTSGARQIDITKMLNWYPSPQCSEASDRAGKLAREARVYIHSDKEKFVAILPQWIKAARSSIQLCHRNPFAF